MTDSTLIADMIRAGVDPDLIQRVTNALLEAKSAAPVAVVHDPNAERRREKDRARKAAARDFVRGNLRKSAESADEIAFPSPSPSSPSPTPPTPPPTPTPVQSASTHEAGGEPRQNVKTPTSEQAIRLAAVFHRRKTTEWTSKEIRAFRTMRIDEADLAAVEAYYSAHWPPVRNKNVLRHDLLTLLGNWAGEVDRAHAWARKNQPDRPKAKDFFAGSSLAPHQLSEPKGSEAAETHIQKHPELL